MKNLITCLTVSVLSGVTFATTWTVDDDGKADFDNIQAAIDAASNGDEIVVMPGTYTGTGDEVVKIVNKDVWLHSSEGAEVTIIDGEQFAKGISCEYVGWFTTIEGFTVTNGYGGSGGGMYNSYGSHTIKNCTFTNNTANSFGGGMNNYRSNPTIENCTFTNNTTNGGGGGMYNSQSNPMLTDCTFTGNTASYGGGMTTSFTSTDDGTTTLTNCIFENNTAETGGGMNNAGSSPTLDGCTFIGNTSTNYGGGGMHNSGDSSPTLTDTIVCGNTPDHIYGYWTDNDGNTIANECPPPAGVCCVTAGCAVVAENICMDFGGTWTEAGSCDDCVAPPETCAADIDGDGEVKVADLLLLIAAWGTCP